MPCSQPEGGADQEFSLQAVIVLESGSQPSLQRLSLQQAAWALLRHCFTARWGQAGYSRKVARADFQACSQLAGTTPVWCLQRSDSDTSHGFEGYWERLLEMMS